MNEKLKELAEQAGFEITPWGNELLPCVHQEGPIDVELTKFAQLIIRECLDSIEQYKNTSITKQIADEGVYSYEQGCIAGMNESVLIIKKHFGVEEQTASQKMADAGYTRRPKGWTKEGTE